jgi:tRNA1(Val) A37 N6-methylase TrmN6
MRSRPPGWSPPGPVPPGPVGDASLAPGPGESLDCLAGHWKIFQLRQGHRYSTDDLLTAWFAWDWFRARQAAPRRHLDLGCGVFSVGLLLLWRFPRLRSVGVEAQAVSARLAERSVRYNGVPDRAEVRAGDLRDLRLPGSEFDLVTGSPPYLSAGEGKRSSRPQRGPCRFEDRGGVDEYLKAARRHLAPGGLVVWCHASRYAEENLDRAAANDLGSVEVRRVVFKEGRESLISLFRAQPGPVAVELLSPLVVRTAAGEPSPGYCRAREEMGFPTGRPSFGSELTPPPGAASGS